MTVGVAFDGTPDRGHRGGERREAVLNDTYGHGVEELCEFLEAYRARSLRGRPRGVSHGARSSCP